MTIDPTLEKELEALDREAIIQASEGIPALKEIDSWIARQAFSADTKAILSKIATTTAKAGQQVVYVGRIAFKCILRVVTSFPTTSVGVVLGAVVGLLISSIPIFGGLLGAFFAPLLIALGLTLGAVSDLKDKALERKIRASIADAELLKAGTV